MKCSMFFSVIPHVLHLLRVFISGVTHNILVYLSVLIIISPILMHQPISASAPPGSSFLVSFLVMSGASLVFVPWICYIFEFLSHSTTLFDSGTLQMTMGFFFSLCAFSAALSILLSWFLLHPSLYSSSWFSHISTLSSFSFSILFPSHFNVWI